MITISAVICTYKRADYLRTALRSLCDQTLPPDQYEVIVVDNAGEAEIEQIVNDFKAENVQLRYVIESRVGLSHARNTGFAEARGKYIAYLDDDARAESQWLAALVEAFEKTDAAAIGGRVWLDWDGQKPSWVIDETLSLFTFLDFGDDGHVIGDNGYLVGANIAFQCDALTAVGGFDANLGRQGSSLLSGEETKILREMRDRGFTRYYEPAAVVWHSVHPSRKRPSWLLRRMFWDGASQPLLNGERPSRSALLHSIIFDLRQCLRWFISVVVAAMRGQQQKAWKSLLRVFQKAGRVRSECHMLVANTN